MDAKVVREALLVDNSENILLTITWVTNKGVCLFRLFPEVTFWDTQQKTNREKRPCFLGCGKDSENRCFTYLGAFMPSECRWVFHWLYSKAMHTLLGRTYLQKSILSLTGGDNNEYRLVLAGTTRVLHPGFFYTGLNPINGNPGPTP
jgi:hypothetical protein